MNIAPRDWVIGGIGLVLSAATALNAVETNKIQSTFLRGYEAGLSAEQDKERDKELERLNTTLIGVSGKVDSIWTFLAHQFPNSNVSRQDPSDGGIYAAEIDPPVKHVTPSHR